MGQLLVTALGVMLLMTAGASFALAMGTVGVMTWAMAHEHGLASFINNPAAATGSYLANVTAGQLAWDLLDFALTFVPGSVLGAGGHAIARTTARDMAASRTLMKEGAKEATQATEQAAARTEAQRVAESQAAHTRAVGRAKEVNRRRRYVHKTVSSDNVAGSNDALSGWSQGRRPDGFQSPNVDDVFKVSEEMEHPRVPHHNDMGTKGRYFMSHAERQKALTAKCPEIGVSRPMCSDCTDWFRRFAQYQKRDWCVTAPEGTWIFKTDGTVIAYDGTLVPPGQPIPGRLF